MTVISSFRPLDKSPAIAKNQLNAKLSWEGLWPITKPGTIFVMHDVNKRSTKDATEDGLMYRLVHQWIHEGLFKGAIFQTPHRGDALEAFGEGYSKDLLPHLAVLIRQ